MRSRRSSLAVRQAIELAYQVVATDTNWATTVTMREADAVADYGGGPGSAPHFVDDTADDERSDKGEERGGGDGHRQPQIARRFGPNQVDQGAPMILGRCGTSNQSASNRVTAVREFRCPGRR